jgi:hypothetical protein
LLRVASAIGMLRSDCRDASLRRSSRYDLRCAHDANLSAHVLRGANIRQVQFLNWCAGFKGA